VPSVSVEDVVRLVREIGNKAEVARRLGITRTKVYRYWERGASPGEVCPDGRKLSEGGEPVCEPGWRENRSDHEWRIYVNEDPEIQTIPDAIKASGADMRIWKVHDAKLMDLGVTMKLKQKDGSHRPCPVRNKGISITLRRRVPLDVEKAVEGLLDQLRKNSPVFPKAKPFPKGATRRSVEVCLLDPHYGMSCYPPAADASWTPEKCAEMALECLERLAARCAGDLPFEEVVVPVGNDFFHADNLQNTTTQGTPQPEAEAYLKTFIGGEALMIEIVERLRKRFQAPIRLLVVPGNHDRLATFHLGRILRAYYHKDKSVTVEADPAPYRFWRYGCNLVGFEHGHSIRQAVRLASLMANECPDDWAATANGFREWHLGDQHRKGSSKPSMFEEQGVSIEYLPGLTPPNEWHKLKSFNWQKRAALAYVWDYNEGPTARYQVNIDRVRNELMGLGVGKN